MADPKQILTSDQIAEAGLTAWRREGETLTARFATGDFATGLALVNRIGASAEEADHHPDLVLTYPEVAVTLSSHDVGGVTSRDISLARTIDEHAAALGVAPAEG
jgi:4a-hydroxytetrahydrobiopterin dehydratase